MIKQEIFNLIGGVLYPIYFEIISFYEFNNVQPITWPQFFSQFKFGMSHLRWTLRIPLIG